VWYNVFLYPVLFFYKWSRATYIKWLVTSI